jgi:hypothetical protein
MGIAQPPWLLVFFLSMLRQSSLLVSAEQHYIFCFLPVTAWRFILIILFKDELAVVAHHTTPTNPHGKALSSSSLTPQRL